MTAEPNAAVLPAVTAAPRGGAAMWWRSALFNLCFYALSAALALTALPLLLAPRRWLVAMMRIWAWSVVWLLRHVCGIRFQVTGREHLPAAGMPAIIAAKHQSAFDTIIWLGLLPDAAYVMKRELLRIPVYGWLARKGAMIAVDRSAGASALRHLVRAGQRAVAEGRQIVIFPEGTRVAPGRRAPYQPGVAALAAAASVPVIPAATDSGNCWGRRRFGKRPGMITLAILPPLPPGMPRERLMRALETLIEAETERLQGFACPVDKGVDECDGLPSTSG